MMEPDRWCIWRLSKHLDNDNVYWYKSDHNSELTCYASGDCDGNDTAISTEQGLSYFYDATNEPLNSWNFTTVWFENENDYPTLRDMWVRR
jgi:hypothetical protein